MNHWRSGQFDAYRVNPPLARLIATWPALLAGDKVGRNEYAPEPWIRTEFELGKRFIAAHGPEAPRYFTYCRWAALPFAALGGWVCFVWARRLYGPAGGLAALSLWAVSPNILAHAQLITPDAAAAAIGTLACYSFWGWLKCPSVPKAAGVGLALGFALLTKFTLLVFGPIWLALWLIHIRKSRTGFVEQLRQIAIIGCLAWYVVNLGYGFEDSFRLLGEFEFVSADFAGFRTKVDGKPLSGNRFTGTVLGWVPVPVPANYLMGIDVQRRDFEIKLDSYLLGEWRRGGWWYYYLYGLIVKETVGVLALTALAGGTAMVRSQRVKMDEAVPFACGLGIIAFVSSQTGFSHHLRYVLPALPLLYVFVARVFAPGRPRWLAVAGWCCVAGAAASSLWHSPHSMSYFNELAGGPTAGPRHMHNSNVDWGQDLLLLKEWCDRHPDRRPVYIAYSGGFDSASLGFWGDGVCHLGYNAMTGDIRLPGWYAIFVGRLFDPPANPDLFERFRGRKPDERVGYTVYLFRE